MGSFPSEVAKELPGRDFPGRCGLPQTIEEWADLKKINDQHRLGFTEHPKLWCIDNKLYDLSGFMSKHPGGATWLQQTQGMDITGYYYTFHLNQSKTNTLLSQYYVRDVSKSNVDDLHTFAWSEDCNYFRLKRKVHTFLTQKYGVNYNEHRWKSQILSMMALIAWSAAFWYLCRYPSMWGALVAACCLHVFIGIGHNYFHQADVKGVGGCETLWRYLFNFTMFSFEQWRLSHAISHHLDINLSDDFEVSALEPFIFFMSCSPTNSPLVYLYVHLFLFSVPGINYLVNALKGRTGINHCMPLVQLAILIACNLRNDEVSLWYVCWCWYVMHGVAGYIMTQVATPVHRSDYCWSEGDENGTKDFVHHTLLSTVDYNTEYPLVASLFLYESFNDHRVHHLFPTLDMSLAKDVRPVVEEFCNENGFGKFVKQKYGFLQLLSGLYRYYYRVTIVHK